MPKRYTPEKNLQRIVGPVVVKLPAPAGTKVAWLSVGGTFMTHQQAGAKNTANSIGYAVGAAGRPAPAAEAFKEVYRAKVPTYVGHWRYNHDTDIRLPAPAEVVYVRYYGRPAVNVIRACLHLTPPTRHDPAVEITHAYKLDGRPVEKTVAMAAPGDYTVTCDGKKVENVSIRIAKPSTKPRP